MWRHTLLLLFLLVGIQAAPEGRRSFTMPLHFRGVEGVAVSGRRRLLRNATMPLHGAVKDFGYFYASLYLGTPPKKFAVIVDTGSTMTYVPCATCGSACGPNHQDAAFDPHLSQTAALIPCNSGKCRCGAPHCACSDAQQCMYTRSYAEQSSSSGVLLEDVLSLHDGGGGAPVIFGCEMRETGEIFKQRADGLFGLGNSDASVVNQLVDAGEIEDTFALCFGMVEGDGAIMLGDAPAVADVTLQYTPLLTSPTHPFYYNVRLASLSVGGDQLDLPPALFDEGYGTVLDSGTTFTYVPTPAFQAFSDAVEAFALNAGLQRVKGPDLQYDDICFGGAPEHTDATALAKVFPAMALHFAPDVTLTLGPLNYLFVHTFNSGKYCLGIFDNGRAGTLLGGISFRNVLVQYDRRKRRVGFGPAACKQLGERHRPPCSAFSTDSSELAAIVAVANGDCQPEALRSQQEEDDYGSEGDHKAIMPTAGAGQAAATGGDEQAAQRERQPRPAGAWGGGGEQQGASQQGEQLAAEEKGMAESGGDPDILPQGVATAGADRGTGQQDGTAGDSGSGSYEEEEVVGGGGGGGVDAAVGAKAEARFGSGSGVTQQQQSGQESGGGARRRRKQHIPVTLGLLAATLCMLAAACVAALARAHPRLLLPRFGRYRQLEGEDPEAGAGSRAGTGAGPAAAPVGAATAGASKGAGNGGGGKLHVAITPGNSGWGGGGVTAKPPPTIAVIAMTELTSKVPGAGGEKRVLGLTTPQKLQRTGSAAAAAAAMAEELAAMRGGGEGLTPRSGGSGLTPRAAAVQAGASPLGGRASMAINR